MFTFLNLINKNGDISLLTFDQIKQLYREYIYWVKPDLWNIFKYFYKLKKYKLKLF